MEKDRRKDWETPGFFRSRSRSYNWKGLLVGLRILATTKKPFQLVLRSRRILFNHLDRAGEVVRRLLKTQHLDVQSIV